jgi:hypothetical protein
MHVDDVIEAIFQRLCIRQQDGHGDHSMTFTELRLALGVTEALMSEASGCSRSRETGASHSPERTA